MPARRPHETGLRLAGEPPSFKAYAARPESEWRDAQDAWVAQFSEGKSSLPPPRPDGLGSGKARASAWEAVKKQHARAKRMSLAAAGDAAANAALDGEAGYALERSQTKKRVATEDGQPWHARPRGPAPAQHSSWDLLRGCWVNAQGDERPEATRNKRRVQQRNDSEEQSRRHQQKWQLYESGGRHYNRTHPQAAAAARAFNEQIDARARKWQEHLAALPRADETRSRGEYIRVYRSAGLKLLLWRCVLSWPFAMCRSLDDLHGRTWRFDWPCTRWVL